MKESLLISQAIAAPILPIYFIGGKCPRAPDPHAEFFRTDFLIKRSDMSTWFYYTPFFT